MPQVGAILPNAPLPACFAACFAAGAAHDSALVARDPASNDIQQHTPPAFVYPLAATHRPPFDDLAPPQESPSVFTPSQEVNPVSPLDEMALAPFTSLCCTCGWPQPSLSPKAPVTFHKRAPNANSHPSPPPSYHLPPSRRYVHVVQVWGRIAVPESIRNSRIASLIVPEIGTSC